MENDSTILAEQVKSLQASIQAITGLSQGELGRLSETIRNSKKPRKWASGSVASYYNTKYANWLKPTLDAMMGDRDNDRFFPKDSYGYTSSTSLRIRIEQAFQFIIDHEDPDGRYAQLRELLDIHPHKSGVRLKWEIKKNMGIAISKDEEGAAWKRELVQFSADATHGQEYKNTKVFLSDDDIKFVIETFEKNDKFFVRKLVRTSIDILCFEEKPSVNPNITNGSDDTRTPELERGNSGPGDIFDK